MPTTASASATPGHRCQPVRLRRRRRRRHDLFPDQFTVQHAENYTLTYADTYKVLTVGETSPGAGAHTYVLVQCGTDAPRSTATSTAPKW